MTEQELEAAGLIAFEKDDSPEGGFYYPVSDHADVRAWLHAKKEKVFLREHVCHSGPSIWGPAGKPGPAGKGPTQSQDSTNTDDSGLKA